MTTPEGQLNFALENESGTLERGAEEIIADIRQLIRMHQEGRLGGEIMPEDVHPKLDPSSAELAHYFTLGMALNYQRNSYSLWRSCTAAWDDVGSRWAFQPSVVSRHSTEELARCLVGHKVALQPNNHVRIWSTICRSLCDLYGGDVRNLFDAAERRISRVKHLLAQHKAGFPYLSGTKISNYWLYVMLQYTDQGLTEKWELNVAPDTHVIAATVRLGLIEPHVAQSVACRELVAAKWKQVLAGTGIDPIEVHTPLWLWSRTGFAAIGRGGEPV